MTLPAEVFETEGHECEFTPYEDGDEERWHFLMRCPECKITFYYLAHTDNVTKAALLELQMKKYKCQHYQEFDTLESL